MSNRKIICLTPVKNEAWILETFLKATSTWADHIIIADQGSTDGSLEIAKQFEKVTLVRNEEKAYNEVNRQQLLLKEARKISGENAIMFALDADELLLMDDPENWKLFHSADPGTTFWLPWINILPDFKTYYEAKGGKTLFGYIDDGKEHTGKVIHSYRFPIDESKRTFLDHSRVLHFQYVFKGRLYSKHRWYECLEKIKFPQKNHIDLYRQYHHIDLPIENPVAIPERWLEFYENEGINIGEIKDDKKYWWDKEVCDLFDKYGVEYFKKLSIWDYDWIEVYKKLNASSNSSHIYDPRSFFDKKVHLWLARSQPDRFSFGNKVVNKILRVIGW